MKACSEIRFPLQTKSIAQVEREAAACAAIAADRHLQRIAEEFAAQIAERLKSTRMHLQARGLGADPENIMAELLRHMFREDDPVDMAAAAALAWSLERPLPTPGGLAS